MLTNKNILSFDIEEYFQVSGLAKAVSRSSWDNFASRVEQNTAVVLNILEKHNIKATFFILGWIAERHPELIKIIADQGHEIACHGYDHKLVYDMTSEEFASDIKKTKDLLESITGRKIYGYRAPSFSVAGSDIEKFEILAKTGFIYDSSLFPMKHFRYGDAYSAPLAPFDIKKDEDILLKEFPMSVVGLLGKRIPAGGGGYFRLYPNFLIRRNFRKIQSEGRPMIIYLHPWEFDPDQPRISKAGYGNTFRHYFNLNKTQAKLEFILKEFRFGTFIDYLGVQTD